MTDAINPTVEITPTDETDSGLVEATASKLEGKDYCVLIGGSALIHKTFFISMPHKYSDEMAAIQKSQQPRHRPDGWYNQFSRQTVFARK